MFIKKIAFSALLLLFSLNIFAENDNDTVRIREMLMSAEFRIDLLNVIQEGKSPLPVYSSYPIKVSGGLIDGVFPYFYRNDDPATSTSSDIKLKRNNQIVKLYEFRESKKKGIFLVKIVHKRAKKKFTVNLEVDYGGYCMLKVTDGKKRTVMYDGRLKLK